MRLFILCTLCLLPVSAFAQSDRYDLLQEKTPENSSRPDRSYRPDSIFSDRVQPSHPGTRPYQSQSDRYDLLQEKTPENSSRPDRSYRPDSIFHDHVKPQRQGR
jgi:hypothetical protein